MYKISYPLSIAYIIQTICPCPTTHVTFCNKLILYGEEMISPHSISKLEDHPLSAAFDYLLIIFTATLHIWWGGHLLHSQPEVVPCCGGARDPHNTDFLWISKQKLWNINYFFLLYQNEI